MVSINVWNSVASPGPNRIEKINFELIKPLTFLYIKNLWELCSQSCCSPCFAFGKHAIRKDSQRMNRFICKYGTVFRNLAWSFRSLQREQVTNLWLSEKIWAKVTAGFESARCCVRRKLCQCQNHDGFLKMTGTKLPGHCGWECKPWR